MLILVGILGFLVVCLSVFSFIQCKRVARLEEENSDLCAEIEELDDENDSLFNCLECASQTVKQVETFMSVLSSELEVELDSTFRVISEFLKCDIKISENKAFFVLNGELHKVTDLYYRVGEKGKIIINSLVLEPFTEKLAEPAIHGLYMAASSIDETVKREKARVLEEEIQGKQKELEKLKK